MSLPLAVVREGLAARDPAGGTAARARVVPDRRLLPLRRKAVARRADLRDADSLREAAVIAVAKTCRRHAAVRVVVGEIGLRRRDRRAHIRGAGGVLRLAAERQVRRYGDCE